MKEAGLIISALLTFFAPAATVLGAAVLYGSDGGQSVTHAELITALVASVLVGAGAAATGTIRMEERRQLATFNEGLGGPNDTE